MDKLVEEIIKVDKQAKKIIDDAVTYKEQLLENLVKEKDEVAEEQKKYFEQKMHKLAEEMEHDAIKELKGFAGGQQDKMENIKNRFEQNKEKWQKDIIENITK